MRIGIKTKRRGRKEEEEEEEDDASSHYLALAWKLATVLIADDMPWLQRAVLAVWSCGFSQQCAF